MNPPLKQKPLVRHVNLFQFLLYYKVEESKYEDFELDDAYVALVDDPNFSSGELVTSLITDHVDQRFIVG